MFYNLEKAKQKRIFSCALEEFSNKEFMNASINKIVQNSNISRGSFYHYFEDKLDVYLYVLDEILDKQSEIFTTQISHDKTADIFDVYRQFLLLNLSIVSHTRFHSFFKNLYMGMNHDIASHLYKKQKQLKRKISKEIDVAAEGNSKALHELLIILELIRRDLLTAKLKRDMTDEAVMTCYDLRISIIQNYSSVIN